MLSSMLLSMLSSRGLCYHPQGYVIVHVNVHMLVSTELCYHPCYHPYVIVHRAMLSSMLLSICYRPQSYVIIHVIVHRAMLLSLCYRPQSYVIVHVIVHMLSSTELCYWPYVIIHVLVHRGMLSSMLLSICYRPCPSQGYVVNGHVVAGIRKACPFICCGYTVPKVIDFLRYNMECVVGETWYHVFLYFSCYIAEILIAFLTVRIRKYLYTVQYCIAR